MHVQEALHEQVNLLAKVNITLDETHSDLNQDAEDLEQNMKELDDQIEKVTNTNNEEPPCPSPPRDPTYDTLTQPAPVTTPPPHTHTSTTHSRTHAHTPPQTSTGWRT